MDGNHDEHYLTSVATLGDARHVVTTQAIFSSKGIKLVEGGVRFNSRLLERLLNHKLLPPLEQCLAVEGGVTRSQLRDIARHLLETDDALGFHRLRDASFLRQRIVDALSRITLLPPLAFKLTVAREQHPDLFDHSLRMTLIALFLADRCHYPDNKLTTIAEAGLFHDLGMLHVDPAMLETGRKLSAADRQYLYSHPITAYLILREYHDYHPQVSTPVFEHHERLDGSGYPRGLQGDEIGMDSQILSLAEIAASFFSDGNGQKARWRLPILLKLGQHKVNRQLTNHLLELVPQGAPTADVPYEVVSGQSFQRNIDSLSAILQDWRSLQNGWQKQPLSQRNKELLDLFSNRISQLNQNLVATGVSLENTGSMHEWLNNDLELLVELSGMAQEAIWQINDITHEMRRRWRDLDAGTNPLLAEIAQWLARTEAILAPM